MDETNRFAPPTAAVDDVAQAYGVQPVRLWPPNGRIGRLRLLAYGLGVYVVFIAVSAALGALVGVMNGGETIATVFGVLSFVVYLVALVALLIQRSHDMDLSGWWTIAAFIPLVGLFWVFKGGTRGVNRWGAPPPPNGLAVRIFGLLLPILFVVGVVAAIALPAFQTYTMRGSVGAPR